jgi:hypothetical protein
MVVGRGGDGPQLGPGDGAPDGGVEVRGTSFLGFDGAEVLHVPADTAAGVLPKPIHQRRKVDGIPRGAPIVIAIRVDRGPVGVHLAVRVQRQGHKRRRAIAAGENLPQGAAFDGAPR